MQDVTDMATGLSDAMPREHRRRRDDATRQRRERNGEPRVWLLKAWNRIGRSQNVGHVIMIRPAYAGQ